MSHRAEKDGGIILPREECHSIKDQNGATWFEISLYRWMARGDVKELHQYDLKELGFTALDQCAPLDISESLRENWVQGAFNTFAANVIPDRGIGQQQLATFYKNLVKHITAGRGDSISVEQLYSAIHHPTMGIRDIAAHLIVKHDNEWSAGSHHPRWKAFFEDYDQLRIAYAKKWLDDMQWMNQVESFKNGDPVWHFHPVVFCSALKDCDQYEITVEMIEALLGHKNPWFTGKNGGKLFAKKFQENYQNVFEFDKKKFVYMLKEIMIKYGIVGPYHKAHFLSQCLHESAHLDTTIEFGSGENYDPGRHSDALKYENTVVGDSPKYRGRGLIQLTWKKNYRLFSQYSGARFVTEPDHVAASMENTIKASAWFWRYNGGIFKKFNANGDINVLIDNDKNNVRLITKTVNGGNNGLAERQ
ncbi:glycoside hydrolase family 19 protein [Acerihabitans sp. TG2]|uniref:glycoside hydrolase family 19 protein n=1 Tax=Acerihabitans sp. TG2 TaxID=3096008 RepID=UPI002B23D2BD|nr:glycoside hydrolase family 19 protein [Acerihabitans sp. TG2]MEA9390199.1 glycoside hydrolase family 19 protein [Acerihabitans sp. TG2]